VRRSEYNQVIDVAQAQAEAQRTNVEMEVNDLLSYGALDWAITDGDAERALTLLGGRIYQRSYDTRWTAYDRSARAKKVSKYQYRAPGEWFAEAYAAYYEPNADGTCDHHVLGNIDPISKTWFDNNAAAWAGDV
jgi:hypothetical protein